MASSSFMGGYAPVNLTNKGGLNANIGNQWNRNLGLEDQTSGNRGAESGSILSGYGGLASGGGYSPQEKSNIEQSTIGGVNNSYNSAADAAQRRMGVTHNAAGYNSFMGGLARSKARDVSSADLNVQSQFANEAYKRKLAGLQGLAQMYGIDTSFLSSLGNQQNELLNIGSGVQARSKGVLGTIGTVAGML